MDNDADIVKALIQNLDRPAFTTPFLNEVSLPNFDKAIEDTIILLNTGIHRLRDGTLINKLPLRHNIKDENLSELMSKLTHQVVTLRDTFHRLRKTGKIKDCGCGQHDCSLLMIKDGVAEAMDNIRRETFKTSKEIAPNLPLTFRS